MKNMTYGSKSDRLNTLSVVATYPTTPASGDPIIFWGDKPGVATINEKADGEVTVCLSGVFSLNVSGVNQSGNSAVAVGDKLYYTDGDTIKLSKKNTGIFFGYAYRALDDTVPSPSPLVASAGSGVIQVAVGL